MDDLKETSENNVTNESVDDSHIDVAKAHKSLEKGVHQGGLVTDMKDYRYLENKTVGVNAGLLADWRGRKVLVKFADFTPDPEDHTLSYSKKMVMDEYIAAFSYSNFLFPTRTPHINLIKPFDKDGSSKFAIASVFFDFQNMVQYRETGGKKESIEGLPKLAAVAFGLMGDSDLNPFNVGKKENQISKVDHGISFTHSFSSTTTEEKAVELRYTVRLALAQYVKQMPAQDKDDKNKDKMSLNVNDFREAIQSMNSVPFSMIEESVGRACDHLKSIGLGSEKISDLKVEYGLSDADLKKVKQGSEVMDVKKESVVKYLRERREVISKLAEDLNVISKIELSNPAQQKDFLDYQWMHLIKDQDAVTWAKENGHKIDGLDPLEWARVNKYQIREARAPEVKPVDLSRFRVSAGHSMSFLKDMASSGSEISQVSHVEKYLNSKNSSARQIDRGKGST